MISRTRLLSVLSTILAVIGLNACDGYQPATTNPTTAPTPALPAPVADESLPANDYISLGMPAYDREWFGQDMAVAAAKLGLLAKQSPEKLPRFGSDRSGLVFARIVSRDNLSFFRSRSLPFASRFPDSLKYFESLVAILKTYLSAYVANKVSGDELIELMGAQLRVVQVELELVDEFLPTLSKDDPQYPARMAGFERMRQGLAEMVSGVITTLTETKAYDVRMRMKLIEYCRETFPSIVPKLSAPSQQEVLHRLDELVMDRNVQDLHDQVVALRDDVRSATKAGD